MWGNTEAAVGRGKSPITVGTSKRAEAPRGRHGTCSSRRGRWKLAAGGSVSSPCYLPTVHCCGPHPHTHPYIHTYSQTLTHKHACIYIYIYISQHTPAIINPHTYFHSMTHISHAYIPTQTLKHTHTPIRTYSPTPVHTHTPTHIITFLLILLTNSSSNQQWYSYVK